MKKFETKILTEDAALAVVQNFRWFAGFRVRAKKIGRNRWSVRAPRWCWSFFVLVAEDYA